jgi:hypothetical protein
LYFSGTKVFANDMPCRLIHVACVERLTGRFEYYLEDEKNIRIACVDVESTLRSLAASLTRARLHALAMQQPNLALTDVLLRKESIFSYVPHDVDSVA